MKLKGVFTVEQDKNDILRRLQKLRVMIDGAGTTHEQKTAQSLFDKLIERYKIKPDELEEKVNRELNCRYGLNRHMIHVCESLGIETYVYRGQKKSPLIIKSTRKEYEIVCDIVPEIERIVEAKKKEIKKIMKSYMYGFLKTSYPISKKEPCCPMCGNVLEYDEAARRYFCTYCTYKGKRLKVIEIDEREMMKGQNDSGRLLTQK